MNNLKDYITVNYKNKTIAISKDAPPYTYADLHKAFLEELEKEWPKKII